MKPLHLHLLTAACALVLLASFLTWMSFRFAPGLALDAGNEPMARAIEQSLSATGWRGQITILGITLPNWMIPVAAAAIASLAWLRATSAWETPRWIGIGLASLCVAHLATLIAVVGANSEIVRLGPGALLAALGSVAMLGLAIFASEPEPAWSAVEIGPSPPGAPLGRVQPYLD